MNDQTLVSSLYSNLYSMFEMCGTLAGIFCRDIRRCYICCRGVVLCNSFSCFASDRVSECKPASCIRAVLCEVRTDGKLPSKLRTSRVAARLRIHTAYPTRCVACISQTSAGHTAPETSASEDSAKDERQEEVGPAKFWTHTTTGFGASGCVPGETATFCVGRTSICILWLKSAECRGVCCLKEDLQGTLAKVRQAREGR